MSEPELRIRQLQQIPVFALRRALYPLSEGEPGEAAMRERFRSLLNRKPRDLKRAVQRLTREELTKLIGACPEISNDQITELFEEYRYGTNPSFYIYLFDPRHLSREAVDRFPRSLEDELSQSNLAQEEGLPRIRGLALNDVGSLPGRPQIIEGNYRFQERMDYVAENQNAVSTYQTLYGFFWVNTANGYVIIHARKPEVLNTLRRAIRKAANIHLRPLVISKQLKNALPFLFRDSFRSGRLHDPNPGPEMNSFRSLTITDDDPYAKGYEAWEDRYPEVPSDRPATARQFSLSHPRPASIRTY